MPSKDVFNTIDQAKLLQILSDLQFPSVAIDTIKDLYAGATTCVRTPAGILVEHHGQAASQMIVPHVLAVPCRPWRIWQWASCCRLSGWNLPGCWRHLLVPLCSAPPVSTHHAQNPLKQKAFGAVANAPWRSRVVGLAWLYACSSIRCISAGQLHADEPAAA